MPLAVVVNRLVARAFGLAQRRYWQHVYDTYRATFEIDPDFRFSGWNVSIVATGRVVLGGGSYIGQNSRIASARGAEVVVGRDCAISTNVRISANERSPDGNGAIQDAVHIGDRVRIGVNCYIGPGVTIGDDAVVGANSVVVKDVPPSAIVGGVPARLIRMK